MSIDESRPSSENTDPFMPPDSENRPGTNLLVEQNRELDVAVKSALAAKIEYIGRRELPSAREYVGTTLNENIMSVIAELGFDPSNISIGPPTKRNEDTKGVDLAFNVAGMAKAAELPIIEATDTIATNLSGNPMFLEVSSAGAFVNIGLDFQKFAPVVIDQVYRYGECYGQFREGEPKVVVIDYSSPNVAKNMTVAHLRSTIIGQSLMHIHEAAGNVPFGINHIGDWGTQFGNIIYEYKKELAEKGRDFIYELEDNPTVTLMRIYRAFNERSKDDPGAVQAAREIFLQLEQGDPELVELWAKFSDWSMLDFYESYSRLGIEFDAVQGESFYEDRMAPAVQEALAAGVVRKNEDGAIVFPSQILTNPTTGKPTESDMFDKEGKPRDEIVVKPNGGTVYLTRDLAAIKYRGEELGASKIIYVIGKEQKSHCLKLFAMADQMGYMPLGSSEHISFGHLNVGGRKMKSREGQVVLLNDLLDQTVAAAREMMRERKAKRGDSSELTAEEEEISHQVGIGAVVFNDLKQNRETDIEFNPDFARSLEAGSAAYIQYTNSRLGSILKKVGLPEPLQHVPDHLSPQEKLILTEIARLPLVIKEAATRNAPHGIASYLTDFCGAVNLFYHEQPIARAGSAIERNFRLNVVVAAQQVIKNAARLIHLELPEKM